MRMQHLPWLAALMVLAACTSKQAYYAGQQWQSSQCSQLADKSDYDACMSRNKTDYDTYRKERERL
jgi:hypothetical protein